jgi:membrane protease YdiL (CAAX protease family)
VTAELLDKETKAGPARELAGLAAGYAGGLLFLLAARPRLGDWGPPAFATLLLLLPLALCVDREALLRFSPRAALLGLLEGLAAAAVLIPFFLLVVKLFWGFNSVDVGAEKVVRGALFQIAVVAVPEEFFYRAFLQAGLEKIAKRKVNLLGTRLGWGWPTTAALFALAHLLARPQPSTLLVFFPALAFGWLWARRQSLVGPVIFHALCNVALLWVPELF